MPKTSLLDVRLCLSWLIMTAALVAGHSQTVSYKPRGETTADRRDYSVSYGKGTRLPRNYNYYYFGRSYAPTAAEFVQPAVPIATRAENVPAPAIGYVKPYSDAQYSDLIIQEMNKERERNGLPLIGVAPAPQSPAAPPPQESPARPVGKRSTGDTAAASRQTSPTTEQPVLRVATIVSVLDHGILVTSEGAQIRLRGVAFPSLNSRHEKRKEFAARAFKGLEELTIGKNVYFVIEQPERGLDGRWLAIVHLADGTELNRLVLESGMAIVSPNEFSDESEADLLLAAMDTARQEKRGFWADR